MVCRKTRRRDGIIILGTLKSDGLKARPDFHPFHGPHRHDGLGKIRTQLIKYRLTQARRTPGCTNFHNAADGVSCRPCLGEHLAHFVYHSHVRRVEGILMDNAGIDMPCPDPSHLQCVSNDSYL